MGVGRKDVQATKTFGWERLGCYTNTPLIGQSLSQSTRKKRGSAKVLGIIFKLFILQIRGKNGVGADLPEVRE